MDPYCSFFPFFLELYFHDNERKMFCQVEAWDRFSGYGVSELTQNVRNKPLLIVSLEKLPGWQEVEGRQKLCNCQII